MGSMIAKVGMKPPHPGAFIREEILEPHGLNVSSGADVLGVRRATLSDLVNEKTSLSPEMGLRIEKAFGVNMDQDVFFHYPSCLHAGAGVVAFADNHVEVHRWRDPRTAKTVAANQIISHSDSSPNNQDLRWIRDRTTTKK